MRWKRRLIRRKNNLNLRWKRKVKYFKEGNCKLNVKNRILKYFIYKRHHDPQTFIFKLWCIKRIQYGCVKKSKYLFSIRYSVKKLPMTLVRIEKYIFEIE